MRTPPKGSVFVWHDRCSVPPSCPIAPPLPFVSSPLPHSRAQSLQGWWGSSGLWQHFPASPSDSKPRCPCPLPALCRSAQVPREAATSPHRPLSAPPGDILGSPCHSGLDSHRPGPPVPIQPPLSELGAGTHEHCTSAAISTPAPPHPCYESHLQSPCSPGYGPPSCLTSSGAQPSRGALQRAVS